MKDRRVLRVGPDDRRQMERPAGCGPPGLDAPSHAPDGPRRNAVAGRQGQVGHSCPYLLLKTPCSPFTG